MKIRIKSKETSSAGTSRSAYFIVYDADKLVSDKFGKPIYDPLPGTIKFNSYYDATLCANQLRIKYAKEAAHG